MTNAVHLPMSRTLPKPELTGPASASPRQSLFLLGPWFDLLFIANLYWPVLLLADVFGGEAWHGGLLFWQVYFVTAPHRWITLFLVGCDRRKTAGREWTFVAVTSGIVGGCLALQLGTNSLLCLGAIDYIWNAWHFASQHHGIHRIYERRENFNVSRRWAGIRKLLFRTFLLYVIARVAGLGWHIGELNWTWELRRADPYMACLPVALLFGNWRYRDRRAPSMSQVYFSSVMLLFLSMLAAAHFEQRQLVLQLALASAVFHSVEYFAIVSWASSSRSNCERVDVIGAMARNWALFVSFFILFLGVTNYVLAVGYEHIWILLNLIVAFLHYAYDGMIWKSQRPSHTRGDK